MSESEHVQGFVSRVGLSYCAWSVALRGMFANQVNAAEVKYGAQG